MEITELTKLHRTGLEEPYFPEIAAWKAGDPSRKAIGYFPVYAPVELIHACGMLPVFISGAMGHVGLSEANGHLQSFVCSVGRSTLELKISSYLDELDGMLFPSTCEVSRVLSGVWGRHDPSKPVINIHLPQNLDLPKSKDYMVNELRRILGLLQVIAGREASREDLVKAFSDYNRRSELLKKLNRFRSEHPERLKASEFYILRLAGMASSVTKHIQILEDALEALKDSSDRFSPKLRLVIVGAFCERPPISMLEEIEDDGIAIVADDLLLGQMWWDEPLPLDGDPIENLANHYMKHMVPNSMIHQSVDTDPGVEVLESLRENNADGFLITSAKSCHLAHMDNSYIVKTCEEHSIPFIRIEFEEDQKVFESIRVQVEALLEARERLPFAGTEEQMG